MNSSFTYKAAAYARASKDDADSSTIENQIELIHDHVKSTPGIQVVSIREDNGFSGIDLLRPSFIEMMKDIEDGKINCVIVKDLSRLGRNYIEIGELLDVTFPQYDVRVIAVNDHYDSINPRSDTDDILLPFKNLMNEHYLRDFSVKIRSNLDVKRKNGEFVAAFAPYGYKRDVNDKHKLVIDDYAGAIVRKIFKMKIDGLSKQKIAEQLNADGEPSPAEYKKRNTNYVGTFQTKETSTWSNVAVGRILSNPIYTGDMVQGKHTTPNYKVKKRVLKEEGEWRVVSGTHEPIISKREFETVNLLLKQDTRAQKNKATVHPLSGFLYCGDCGNSMTRSMSGKYTYYVCASSLRKGGCTSHCILDKKLEAAVFDAITKQISYAPDIEKALESAKASSQLHMDTAYFELKINDREKEIRQCEEFKSSLHTDYKNGIISIEDFISFNNNYTSRIKELRNAVVKLKNEAKALLENEDEGCQWLDYITEFKNIPELNRQVVVNLINRIEIFTGKRVLINMRYQDRLETVQDILNSLHTKKTGCD